MAVPRRDGGATKAALGSGCSPSCSSSAEASPWVGSSGCSAPRQGWARSSSVLRRAGVTEGAAEMAIVLGAVPAVWFAAYMLVEALG